MYPSRSKTETAILALKITWHDIIPYQLLVTDTQKKEHVQVMPFDNVYTVHEHFPSTYMSQCESHLSSWASINLSKILKEQGWNSEFCCMLVSKCPFPASSHWLEADDRM